MMLRISGRSILLLFLLALSACASIISAPDSATNNTYRNPLMNGQSFADPHVIKVGDTYYLYATTHLAVYGAFVSKD